MLKRASIASPGYFPGIGRSPFASRDRSPSLTDKPRRLSKSSASSLTRRLPLLLAVLFTLYILGRLFLPNKSSNTPSRRGTSAELQAQQPRDYLNESSSNPAPFSFCPIFGPGDELGDKYGAVALTRTILHVGTGARVQRVIRKAMSGLPITISVLGGSVSSCHGTAAEPISSECYPTRFFSWWNSVFPHPASELTNGARPRTNSAYFSFCNEHHLPDQTDLIILEFDSDDPSGASSIAHFEVLVRSILLRPDHPALIIVGHFAPQTHSKHGFGGPETSHTLVAQFYDIPHISTKGLLYFDYVRNPDRTLETYYIDPVLPNDAGHKVLADTLIHYFQSQICVGWSAALGYSFDVPAFGSDGSISSDAQRLFGWLGGRKDVGKEKPGSASSIQDHLKLPPFLMETLPSEVSSFKEVQPYCVSANDLINPLPSSLFSGSGWSLHHPPPGSGDENEHYWHANSPNSRLRIPIKVSAGDVAVWYMREPIGKNYSLCSCWVDNNYSGGWVLAASGEEEEARPTIELIDRFVEEGSHFVECELDGNKGEAVTPFRILGVFAT